MGKKPKGARGATAASPDIPSHAGHRDRVRARRAIGCADDQDERNRTPPLQGCRLSGHEPKTGSVYPRSNATTRPPSTESESRPCLSAFSPNSSRRSRATQAHPPRPRRRSARDRRPSQGAHSLLADATHPTHPRWKVRAASFRSGLYFRVRTPAVPNPAADPMFTHGLLRLLGRAAVEVKRSIAAIAERYCAHPRRSA